MPAYTERHVQTHQPASGLRGTERKRHMDADDKRPGSPGHGHPERLGPAYNQSVALLCPHLNGHPHVDSDTHIHNYSHSYSHDTS